MSAKFDFAQITGSKFRLDHVVNLAPMSIIRLTLEKWIVIHNFRRIDTKDFLYRFPIAQKYEYKTEP